MKDFKYGLKLWSTNDNYVKEAVRLFEQGIYNYIELYIKPGSYDKYIDIWKQLRIPYVIHAPHFLAGMNLAIRGNIDNNINMAKESIKYADDLKADIIIFHPGIGGKEEETVYQLKQINDGRIVVENKPYQTIDGSAICNGHSPEQISYILKEASVGFCLDIGHALCAAISMKSNPYQYYKEYLHFYLLALIVPLQQAYVYLNLNYKLYNLFLNNIFQFSLCSCFYRYHINPQTLF